MDKGVPESVAHRLADDLHWSEVKDLTRTQIREIVYGVALDGKTLENIAKTRIIYYLIDPQSRMNPAMIGLAKAPFGIFNWWWGENNEEPNRILRDWRKLNVFNTQELRNLLMSSHLPKTPKPYRSGEKPVLMGRLMRQDLSSGCR